MELGKAGWAVTAAGLMVRRRRRTTKTTDDGRRTTNDGRRTTGARLWSAACGSAAGLPTPDS
jgi:hypothetical protein